MINLPMEAQQATKKFLLDQYSKQESMAIVLDILFHSELGLLCSKELNAYLSTNPYNDIFLYTLNRDLVPEPNNFAIYHATDLPYYSGTVVATDLPTWQACRSSCSKNKWLYIYDVNRLSKIDRILVHEINSSGFKVFTRSKEHRKFLLGLGLNVLEKYLPEIIIKDMMEIVNG